MKVLGQKIFWVKNFGIRKILAKKTWIRFFCLKKQVGLKMYAPPPSEHSRVKILLGLSYLSKKIFCKEKNIGRVNPGRGGVDDPPPRK